jgi:hypothetical protein
MQSGTVDLREAPSLKWEAGAEGKAAKAELPKQRRRSVEIMERESKLSMQEV